MSDNNAKALEILKQMLGPEIGQAMNSNDAGRQFAGKIGPMAFKNVFEPLWANDVFDLKTRSLVTIAILIALRAKEELEIHFPAAIRNGATLEELEEVIYQASGYAGFPAAHSAREVAISALTKAGMLPGESNH